MRNFLIWSKFIGNTAKNFTRSYSIKPKMGSENPLVAIVQMTAMAGKEQNFEVCEALIQKAKKRGAQMVFLPECFDYIAENKVQTLEQAERLDGPLMKKFKELAKDKEMWLSLGGFHHRGPRGDEERVSNSHIMIDSTGTIRAVYDKVHLFNVELPGNVRMREADYTIAGEEISKPVDTPVGKVGLGVCYDLRFPEFSLALRKKGAEILTYPSAFTQTTGKAHWESLLRCRAIETQCYVIAAAQTGVHSSKRASYGHSMIVDPWGCVIAQCKEGVGIAVAELDFKFLKKIREDIPVISHRRPDLYMLPTPDNIEDTKSYAFGQVTIKSSQLFYKTNSSMAFVNRKPVVPGHALISPLRVVEKFTDMNPEEMTDFIITAQKVEKVLKEVYKTDSCTLTIQDGALAGQTIQHVHMHILPRHEGDFQDNNDIYIELQNHDKNVQPNQWRTEEDMADEASELRLYFEDI